VEALQIISKSDAITQEQIDEIENVDLFNLRRSKICPKDWYFQQVDIFMFYASDKGFNYLRDSLYRFNQELNKMIVHYYNGQMKFVGLLRCGFIIERMHRLMCEPSPNFDLFLILYYMLQLSLNESYREFLRMKHWLGFRYFEPDYTR